MSYLRVLFLVFFLCIEISANEIDKERIRRVLHEIPEWKNENSSLCSLEGGLTNMNYKVTIDNNHYFFRLGTKENSLLNISLEKEFNASITASCLGIAPKVIHYCPKECVLVSEFIQSASEPVNLRDIEMQQKICQSLRELHFFKIEFQGTLCPFETIKLYWQNALSAGALFPELLEESIFPLVDQICATLEVEWNRVPCHNDLHIGNFLNDGQKIWIIDWEYAAMGDPLFDLATLVSVEGFTDGEAEILLYNYLQRRATQEELKGFLFKCALADLRWGIWYYLQDKISEIDYNFIDAGEFYLNKSFTRLNTLSNPEKTS